MVDFDLSGQGQLQSSIPVTASSANNRLLYQLFWLLLWTINPSKSSTGFYTVKLVGRLSPEYLDGHSDKTLCSAIEQRQFVCEKRSEQTAEAAQVSDDETGETGETRERGREDEHQSHVERLQTYTWVDDLCDLCLCHHHIISSLK